MLRFIRLVMLQVLLIFILILVILVLQVLSFNVLLLILNQFLVFLILIFFFSFFICSLLLIDCSGLNCWRIVLIVCRKFFVLRVFSLGQRFCLSLLFRIRVLLKCFLMYLFMGVSFLKVLKVLKVFWNCSLFRLYLKLNLGFFGLVVL